MRIVAGRWRGRRIVAPPGRAVRPTADRVREAVFSILGERVRGASVLDLFAGTGALGFEALSRGAARAVFVESDGRALDALRRNAASLGAGEARLVAMDFRAALQRLRAVGERFDVIFLDPPYGKGLAADAAGRIARAGLAAPGALVVVEEAACAPRGGFPADWAAAAERRYGDTAVTLFQVPPEAGAEDSPDKEEG